MGLWILHAKGKIPTTLRFRQQDLVIPKPKAWNLLSLAVSQQPARSRFLNG
jgi:hypothetical protein